MMKKLDDLAAKAIAEVAAVRGAKPETIRMVELHLSKPWLRNYKAMLLSPLRPNMDRWFKVPVLKAGGRIWYYPSTFWWTVHAKAAHPPNGAGCDPAIHARFLTESGAASEFAYATLFEDKSLDVLGARDFETECAWWEANF